MLGVLVVILRPDQIAGLGFRLRQRDVPLIVSLRVLRTLLLIWSTVILRPPPLLLARGK